MAKNNKKIFTFGEIMLRISPTSAGERITQALAFTVEPGGSEANVAIALSLLGDQSGFITRFPKGGLSDKIIRYLRSYAVDTAYVTQGGERVGVYWTETGIGVQPYRVIYDREHSAFSGVSYKDFNWNTIFKKTHWFHISGISPAVSESACNTVKKLLNRAPADIKISIDLNYRSKLWKWVEKRRFSIHKIMRNICAHAYLVTGNESDFFNALGMGNGKEKTNKDYEKMASQCFKRFPNFKYVAISLRKPVSASENGWSGLLFSRKKGRIVTYKGPELRITDIVDRIGTGDSFTAGIIYGIINHEQNLQHVVDFAVGLSALNHSVKGDASQFRLNDVEHLLNSPDNRIIR